MNTVIKLERAPRPPNKTISQAVYDVIQELGGSATLSDVVKYMPAQEMTVKYTRKQIKAALSNSKSRGYFVRDGDRFKIAPITYYKAKQEAVRQWESNKTKSKQPKNDGWLDDQPKEARVIQSNPWMIAFIGSLL